MIYIQIFLSFLQIGALSFGGGYAAMPLIQQQVVTSHGWLSIGEFTDLITIAEMTPGPIAVNSATFVGMKLAGVGGALVATVGCVLPSIILVTVIAALYLRYRNMEALQSVLGLLRPAVVAMIAAAGVTILIASLWGGKAVAMENFRPLSLALFAGALALLVNKRKKLNPIAVMVLAGLINVAVGVAMGAA